MQETQADIASIPFSYDIRFTDSEPSPAVRFQIEQHLARIARVYDRITDCRVAVMIPHKHSATRHFHIQIQLDIPGKRLAVSRNPEASDEHVQVRRAVNDAFHKLTRQLEDFLKARNRAVI